LSQTNDKVEDVLAGDNGSFQVKIKIEKASNADITKVIITTTPSSTSNNVHIENNVSSTSNTY
jgi:hypothetical protein